MKNKYLILLCCIFGGWFGLHCFIEGKIKKGILYLFTAGLFCIGWLVDIITIACQNQAKTLENKSQSKHITYRFTIDECDNKKKTLYSQTRSRKYYDDYIVFDLETTGFNPKDDEIIEIGALKFKNDKLIDTFNVLVKPKARLTKNIIELTGITENMLKNCDSIEIALPKFIEFIENYPLVAHNSPFDLGFIEENIKNLNLPIIKNKNIDTLYLSRINIKDVLNHKLETLKMHFNLNYSSHRAIEDCYVTNYIYQYCKDKNTVKN